jgi:EAL domain-containing protein (putative c-di-GMP-specific phosphodiesterase class I)
VTSINENSESAAIVNAITRLADSLNLAVTAEGIEDQLIEARLRSSAATRAKGWLYGKPIAGGRRAQAARQPRLLRGARASERQRAEAERSAGSASRLKVDLAPTHCLDRADMMRRFHKMHGLGNDFVVLDARESRWQWMGRSARAIADRRTGIGCDQLIVLEHSSTADLGCASSNADGGEAKPAGTRRDV